MCLLPTDSAICLQKSHPPSGGIPRLWHWRWDMQSTQYVLPVISLQATIQLVSYTDVQIIFTSYRSKDGGQFLPIRCLHPVYKGESKITKKETDFSFPRAFDQKLKFGQE